MEHNVNVLLNPLIPGKATVLSYVDDIAGHPEAAEVYSIHMKQSVL